MSSSSSVQAPLVRFRREQRLDGPAVVHRGVSVADAVEVGLEVENLPGVDAAVEDVVEQVGDVGRAGAGPPCEPTLRKNVREGDGGAVGDPDDADGGAGPGDSEGGGDRLAGTDALEGGVDADPAGEVRAPAASPSSPRAATISVAPKVRATA